MFRDSPLIVDLAIINGDLPIINGDFLLNTFFFCFFLPSASEKSANSNLLKPENAESGKNE
jgi:hypothetical protein